MRYAVQQTSAPTRRSHFRFVRTSGVLCISCWCGKVALLETRNINVFTRRCNDFLYDHTYCEQFVKVRSGYAAH